MRKTKLLITAFAVLASLLMLMTSTMAGPVTEKTNMDIVENTEQKLINSLETFITDIQNDRQITTLTEKLTKDRDLKQIEYLIENTEETLEKRILTEDYLNCLEQKTEYLVLEKHIESEYFEKIKNIAELSGELLNTANTDEPSNDLIIGGAIDLGPSLTNDNDPSVEGANFVLSDPAQSYGMDSCLPTMELLHNSNGEIYIPELGWVPESEYGWIEDILENLVLEGISEFLEVAGLILILASYYIFPVASAICAIIGMILQEIGLSGSFWIGLANLFVNLMIFGMIFGAALILIGLLLETISQETNTDP